MRAKAQHYFAEWPRDLVVSPFKLDTALHEVLSTLGDEMAGVTPGVPVRAGREPREAAFFARQCPLLRLVTGLCEGADAVAAEALLQANPGSAQATRDVVVAHYQMAAFANRHSAPKDTTRHRRAIYELLRPAIERGMTFDPPTVQFYEELKAEFAQ